MSTIPASQIVNVVPNVISASGNGLVMNGLVLSNSGRVPIGSILSFPTALSVAGYFGANSKEAAIASVYFAGYNGATLSPGSILLATYPQAAQAAWLRGGTVSGLSLSQIQAINGTFSVVVDGYTHTGSVSLASASSFSTAATLLNAAITASEPVQANVTGTLGGIVTGAIAANSCTAAIANTVMTVSAVVAGTVLAPGQTITGTSVAAGTTIVSQLTGTAGGTGTYLVSISQTIVSETITATGGGFTVSAVTSGALAVGQTLTGSGVTAGTTITALGTGTGGTGTYAVSVSQTVASETVNATGTNLIVSAVSSGVLAVGQTITGTSIPAGAVITAQVSGTAGGVGVYTVAAAGAYYVASEALVASATAPAVTYDSTAQSFVVTSGIAGTASTIAYASGVLAVSLYLTSATGAVLSQGAAAATPSAFMSSVIAQTTNFATFMTAFDPDALGSTGNAQKQLFAAWNATQNNEFAYVCWDADITPTASTAATSSLGYILTQNSTSGTILIYEPTDLYLAPFVCGMVAAINFTQTNGRPTLAFKGQSGLGTSVNDPVTAANLIANGYNFYGNYANANNSWQFLYPGSITGKFKWADSYVNQIWLNNALQNSLMALLTTVNSVPYNSLGYGLIRSALTDPINAALNYGAMRAGVPLSALQAAEVNAAAGLPIDQILYSQGYYIQVLPATAAVRALRQSPPITVWYMDGQSVQQISLSSTEVM